MLSHQTDPENTTQNEGSCSCAWWHQHSESCAQARLNPSQSCWTKVASEFRIIQPLLWALLPASQTLCEHILQPVSGFSSVISGSCSKACIVLGGVCGGRQEHRPGDCTVTVLRDLIEKRPDVLRLILHPLLDNGCLNIHCSASFSPYLSLHFHGSFSA